MRDRQPTKVLENGALRYGVYDETGALLRYEYLALEDAPSDVGTDLSKANLLTDDTETALFGSAADRTINDAFAGLAVQIKLIKDDVASITVTLKDSAGTAIPGVLVQGILSESGQAVYSNTSGMVSGYIPEGSQTIKVTGYADIADYSETISVTKGTSITKTITLTTRNFLKITSSQSVKFSGNVNTIDVTAVGGGGSGGCGETGYSGDDTTYLGIGGGGGGGGYCTVTAGISVTANTSYPAVVGAGGAVWNDSTRKGNDGGQSSFLDVTANGGKGGGGGRMYDPDSGSGSGQGYGGVGNGNGGNGTNAGGNGLSATQGSAGSVAGYSSFTATVVYGGGGGGSNLQYSGASGAGYGGTASTGNGQDGFGGGGCGTYSIGSNKYGKGGSGCVAIRMHLKSAA